MSSHGHLDFLCSPPAPLGSLLCEIREILGPFVFLSDRPDCLLILLNKGRSSSIHAIPVNLVPSTPVIPSPFFLLIHHKILLECRLLTPCPGTYDVHLSPSLRHHTLLLRLLLFPVLDIIHLQPWLEPSDELSLRRC